MLKTLPTSSACSSVILLMGLIVCSSVPAQSTQFASKSSSERPFTVTVRSFGFDTAPTIQAAVKTVMQHGGGVVRLTPGLYPLQRRVDVMNAHDVSIIGYGATLKAAHKMTVTSDGHLIQIEDSDRIQVLGLTFDGDSKSRGFHPGPQSIVMDWSRDVLIADCSFRNAPCDDIFMWGGVNPPNAEKVCKRIQITRCVFDNANRNAISVVNAADVRIDHNVMKNVRNNDPQAGVDVEPNYGDPPNSARRILIDHNRIINCCYGLTVKQIASPSDVWIIGNSVEQCRYGIGNDAANSLVEWNTVIESETFGIAVGWGDKGGSGLVQNNTIIRCRDGVIADAQHVARCNTIK